MAHHTSVGSTENKETSNAGCEAGTQGDGEGWSVVYKNGKDSNKKAEKKAKTTTIIGEKRKIF
eukprot:14223313-Ditylum_brightwellii.AAC.1